MPTARSFEELAIWKLSRDLVKEIYLVTRSGAFARDFGLRDQLRRAAVSIVSNIAEGFERGGNQEFIRFLSIAKGSAGEVRAQLYNALDIGYLESSDFKRPTLEVVCISKQISTLISHLEGFQQRTLRTRGSSKPSTLNL